MPEERRTRPNLLYIPSNQHPQHTRLPCLSKKLLQGRTSTAPKWTISTPISTWTTTITDLGAHESDRLDFKDSTKDNGLPDIIYIILQIGTYPALARITAYVNNNTHNVLLDSCSCSSLINTNLVQRDTIRPLVQPVGFKGLNALPVLARGISDVSIEIAGEEIKFPLYCLDEFNYGILLGTDFLSNQGIKIDFSNNTVTWHNKTIRMHPIKSGPNFSASLGQALDREVMRSTSLSVTQSVSYPKETDSTYARRHKDNSVHFKDSKPNQEERTSCESRTLASEDSSLAAGSSHIHGSVPCDLISIASKVGLPAPERHGDIDKDNEIYDIEEDNFHRLDSLIT